MHVGIGSYTFPWAIGIGERCPAHPLTAVQLLERAAAMSVGVVQICDNLPLEQMSLSELTEIRTVANRLNLTLEIGTRGIAPEHLREFLRLAQFCASPIVRVVVDTLTYHPSPDEVIAGIQAVLPEYHTAGVTLAIENHDRFTAGTLAAMMRQLDSPFAGICLDTVNSFGALEGPEVVVTTLAPWVVSLHVKDYIIARAGHQLGFTITGCPAGTGRLNLPWVLAQLHAVERTPNAILEQWTPPEYDLMETIAKEERWAWESVHYLQRVLTKRG